MRGLSRRAVLAVPLVVPVGAISPRAGAQGGAAREESFAEAEGAILAGRTPVAGGVVLDIPPSSENGNSVDVSVTVESPMTVADHVTAVHLLAERNPIPRVATFHLSARAGRAEVATRIRLATSGTVVALVETSRGAVHRASQEVIVILGACLETG